MFPGYQSLYEIAKSIGCSVSQWKPVVTSPAEGCKGSIRFEVEDLRKLVTSQTKLIVMNFPHNPTGMWFIIKVAACLSSIMHASGFVDVFARVNST